MKILSIAIPCYNSEQYMEKCIDSLLVGGDSVEIIIVDDGQRRSRTAMRRSIRESSRQSTRKMPVTEER